MALVKKLSARLQNHPKRIVYPDGEDLRIMQAARQFATRKLGVPILLGDRENIKSIAAQNDIRLDGIKIITPKESDDFQELCKAYKAIIRFHKNTESEDVEAVVETPIYYAALMLATGRADAMLAGANSTTASALRPILQVIPLQKGVKTASSMMILSTGREDIGVSGDLFLADCDVIAEPTEEQICDIALTTGTLANQLTLQTARVAMLACTSKSPTSSHATSLKMRSAAALVHAKAKADSLDIEVDGELQVDAALSPEVARLKNISSSVAGKANVLVFPDLNSGNITSKMAQIIFPDVECYGQILTGLTKPVAEISRGATTAGIFGTSVIVAAQAVDRKFIDISLE